MTTLSPQPPATDARPAPPLRAGLSLVLLALLAALLRLAAAPIAYTQ